MSFNAPTPPNPLATSQAQQQFNLQAGQQQNQVNAYNQSNAYGGMNYVKDPNSPSGYTLQTSLSPQEQALFNTSTGTANIAGQTAGNLLGNASSMYSTPFNLSGPTGAIAGNLNQWQQQYLQPIFNQQSSNLEAQLRNQGLTPGTEAYNNAKNLLARNQGDITNQYLTSNEQQAFNQALQQYSLPLQTAGSLFGMGQPTQPTFQQTPTAQIQPPNYQGQVQQNYQNQLQNYQNQWNNIAKLGVAGIGLAGAPFTGGASLGLAGGLGSIFGSSPQAGYGNFGQYSPYSPMNA